MAIERFISTHGVFTTDELLEACGDSATNKNLLSRAVAAGKVLKLRRGLYASRCGRFEELTPDPLEVALKLLPGCVFSYQTALELYGVAHSPTQRLVTSYSFARFSGELGGVRYESWPCKDKVSTRWLSRNRVATAPEQTFVDCLAHPERALGYENVLRSVGALPVSPKTCLEKARATSLSALSKTCWALEALGQTEGISSDLDEVARSLKGKCFSVFGRRAAKNKVFDARWRLYVPNDAYELIQE